MFNLAATAVGSITPEQLISNIKGQILNPIIVLLFALALLYFLYGVFEFIRNSNSGEGRSEGGKHILWGLIGMFIMVSAFGLMNLICHTIGCAN